MIQRLHNRTQPSGTVKLQRNRPRIKDLKLNTDTSTRNTRNTKSRTSRNQPERILKRKSTTLPKMPTHRARPFDSSVKNIIEAVRLNKVLRNALRNGTQAERGRCPPGRWGTRVAPRRRTGRRKGDRRAKEPRPQACNISCGGGSECPSGGVEPKIGVWRARHRHMLRTHAQI